MTTSEPPPHVESNRPFSLEDLQNVWQEFAEQKKMYAAEFQLLNQPFDLRGKDVVLHLHNPVQETILNTLRSDLLNFLRTRLRNSSIALAGELKEQEATKVMYTPREKFEYLQEKNPLLKELKDRLGLDTDF